MNKFKLIAKVLAIVAVVAVISMATVPLFIRVQPLQGLAPARQLAGSESRFVTIPFEGTDGIDIHYVADELAAEDSEPTFVLLHGSLFNVYTWNKVMGFFGERGRVVAYDQIPYGLSEKLVAGDWTGPNPYTSQAAVEQLFLFLDVLDLDDVVLVGSSYGGTLAVQATLANPERVRALILVDAAVYVQEEMPTWIFNLPQMRSLGPLFARQFGNNQAFIRQTYLDPERISAERMALTTIHTQIEDWDGAMWQYLKVWGRDAPDLAAGVSKIEQPALVIAGDGDAIVPVADSERLHAALPDSELVIIPSCGHLPQEECSEAFIAAVAVWLEQQGY